MKRSNSSGDRPEEKNEQSEAQDHPERHFEVGYCRPPKQHQFQPGRSGNSKGRPTSARGLKTLLRTEQRERVRVTENGKPKSLSKLELVVKRLVEKASKGEPKAISELIGLNITLFGMEDDENREAPLTAEQQIILQNLQRRRALGDEEAGLAIEQPIADESTGGEGGQDDGTPT